MINWLHISDLHLGSEGAITNMMRDELPEYLKELGVKCDYVFCTGDIRTANVSSNVFTDEMADYLKSICDAVQTSVDRLYIVAGNHDVDRDVDGRHDVIRKVFYDSERYYHPDNVRTRSGARFKASVFARMDIASRVRRLAETIALAN